MSTNVVFPPSYIVNVSVQGTPQFLNAPNINTAALISSESPSWSGSSAYTIYTNATQVGIDFGTSSKAFAIATAFFAQNPNPLNEGGYLVIVQRTTGTPATLAVQDLTYTAKATGTGGNSISITYTGGAVAGQEVVTLVGSAITVQIASGVSTAQQVLNAVAASTAASALVSVYVSGTSSSAQTTASVTSLSGGSGSGTEPVLNAIVRTLNSVYYFGILVDTQYNGSAATFAALTTYVQSIQKLFFYCSSNIADFESGGIEFAVQQSGLTNTRCLYYSDGVTNDVYSFAAAYASRGLSTNWAGSLTAQTMNLKQLTGFQPDQTLTTTYLTQVQAAGVDVYPSFGGDPGLYTSGANGWFDQIYGQFWLLFAIQTAGFNFLAQTNSKIPQTEIGMTGLKGAYMTVLAQGVNNGFIAPGAWTGAAPFGVSTDLIRNVAQTGFYIYSLPVANQTQSDRNNRKAPLVQIAVKLAGAIHSSQVIVQVQE